jgi:N6-adenosine-specific RNA methylase IME4
VIAADVPWPYEVRKDDPSHRATHDFPQMSIVEICAFGDKVREIAHDDCILLFWTTNHHMRQSYEILDAWGFESKTIVTWVKDTFGYGDWARGQTEHFHVAVRGKPTVEVTKLSTVIYGPVRENSRKPDQFYDWVEAKCPASSSRYAYLFSRDERPNWDMHGDEVGLSWTRPASNGRTPGDR